MFHLYFIKFVLHGVHLFINATEKQYAGQEIKLKCVCTLHAKIKCM